MKKTLFALTLLCFITLVARSQSLTLDWSSAHGNPGDTTLATPPSIVLDTATRTIHYSFTVNYPTGSERSDFRFGGSYFYIDLYDANYNVLLWDAAAVNTETDDINEYPEGPVTYSGSVYIGDYYDNLSLVTVSWNSTFMTWGNVFRNVGSYDEWFFTR